MAEVPQSPHFNLLTATSQPNEKSRELRLYLKVSSSRKFGSNRYICREKEGVPLIQIILAYIATLAFSPAGKWARQ